MPILIPFVALAGTGLLGFGAGFSTGSKASSLLIAAALVGGSAYILSKGR